MSLADFVPEGLKGKSNCRGNPVVALFAAYLRHAKWGDSKTGAEVPCLSLSRPAGTGKPARGA